MSNLKTVVYQRLEAIAAAEKITRAELGHLSRELLIYVPETNDIEIVNRLVGILTPMNREIAIIFFSHFLPWKVEKDTKKNFVRFGKKLDGYKQTQKRLDAINAFLKDENANIWTWADENVDKPAKKKDFAAMVQKAVKKAVEGDEKTDTPPLSHDQVMDAVLLGGMTIEDMLAAVERAEERRRKVEEEFGIKDVTPPEHVQIEAQAA